MPSCQQAWGSELRIACADAAVWRRHGRGLPSDLVSAPGNRSFRLRARGRSQGQRGAAARRDAPVHDIEAPGRRDVWRGGAGRQQPVGRGRRRQAHEAQKLLKGRLRMVLCPCVFLPASDWAQQPTASTTPCARLRESGDLIMAAPGTRAHRLWRAALIPASSRPSAPS